MGFAWTDFLEGAGSAIERRTPSRTACLSPTAASGRAWRVCTPHPLDPAPRSEQGEAEARHCNERPGRPLAVAAAGLRRATATSAAAPVQAATTPESDFGGPSGPVDTLLAGSEQSFADEFAAGSGTGGRNPNRIELQVPIVPGRPEPLVASTTPIPTGIPACAWGTPSGPFAEPKGETP